MNTRPQEKVSRENYEPCLQLLHGQSLYYGQIGSRAAHCQCPLSLFSRMSEASLREFREYYVTTALKWVTNLSMFCVQVSRDQRTNPLPCSVEVLFTGWPALIAISYTMDRLTEPWKQGSKNIKGRFGLETTTPKFRAQHANQFVHSIDFDHATIVDRARNFARETFS